jgi:Carboxypeptidase regulatory-like domain
MLLQTMLLMLALAPQAKAAQQPEQIARAWRISGTVVDAHRGAPLARCSVQIEPVADGGASQVLVTGEDGQFHFDGLAQGKYQLTASKRGYLTQAYEEHDGLSTAIAVGPELKSEGLIFNVIPQAVISGLVADERGEPGARGTGATLQGSGRIEDEPGEIHSCCQKSPSAHRTNRMSLATGRITRCTPRNQPAVCLLLNFDALGPPGEHSLV